MCSPCCAIYALRNILGTHHDGNTDVQESVEHTFYVDKGLQILPMGAEAKSLVDRLQSCLLAGGLNGPVILPLGNTVLQMGGQRAVSYGSPRPPSTRTNSGPELLARHPRLQTSTCPERTGTTLRVIYRVYKPTPTYPPVTGGSDHHSVMTDGKTFLLPSTALGTPWGSSTSPLHHPPA